jgi:hypothetical protein
MEKIEELQQPQPLFQRCTDPFSLGDTSSTESEAPSRTTTLFNMVDSTSLWEWSLLCLAKLL